MRIFMYSKLRVVLYPLLAISTALLLGSILIAFLGFSPGEALSDWFKGAFWGRYQVGETLIKASPVILTGLSYATAKRCGLINLGAEGQLYMGALLGTLIATNLNGLPMAIHLSLTIFAGFIGGALYGCLASILRLKFGASEIITTIMLNSVATSLVSYCVSYPMMDQSSNLPQSSRILPTATLPRLFSDTRVHMGILLVILAILGYYFLMQRTTIGYEMRLIGQNENAGRYAGIKIARNKALAMLIAGGFAGLGGVFEIIGVQYRLLAGFSNNYGFDGIAVALLGNNHPIGIGLAGLLFGALRSGSSVMEMSSGVPSAIIYIIQGFVILFVVGQSFFQRKTVSTARRKGVHKC